MRTMNRNTLHPLMVNKRHGKSYQQYQEFISMVRSGLKPIVVGREYVVISTEHFRDKIKTTLSLIDEILTWEDITESARGKLTEIANNIEKGN